MEANQKNTVFTAVVTAFITTFMGSALNLSAPDIESDFQVSAQTVGWVVTVYMLTCAALAAPFGRIADLTGKKRILWLGILIFALASGAACFSTGMGTLLLFRFLQGVGASMIFSTNIAILVGAFDSSLRGKMLGYATSATYVGLSAGPVLGGILNEHFGWRAVFAAAACVSAVSFVSAFWKLPDDAPGAEARTEEPGTEACSDRLSANGEAKEAGGRLSAAERFDAKGNALYVCAIVAMMFGLSTMSTLKAALPVLTAGAVLFVFFIRAELKAKSPAIDIRLFRSNISYAFSNLAAMLNYGATFAISYLISIYLQVVLGYDSQTAGLVLIVSPVIMSLLSPLMGRLSDKHSPYAMSSGGMALCAAALALFAFMPQGTGIWAIMGILAISGLGFSLFSSPNTNAVMASVEKESYGVASSVLATMRSIGHTSSMAVVTAVVGAYMGDMSLAEASPELLLRTMHACFFIFTGLCLAGIFIALKRKR